MSARGEAMAATRRLDSQLKRERVAAAVDALAAGGREISIAAIARHAGVNHRLRQQLGALEQRLSEALGRDIADELEPRPDELGRQLQDAHAQIFELREQLADAREELDAVREINRELLADRNRPAP